MKTFCHHKHTQKGLRKAYGVFKSCIIRKTSVDVRYFNYQEFFLAIAIFARCDGS